MGGWWSSVKTWVLDIIIYHRAARWTLFTGAGRGLHYTATPITSVITTANSEPMPIPLPEDVPIQNSAKSQSELPDAIGINEGIHNRVCMWENNSNIHHPYMWPPTVLTQEVETVDDVQGKPTYSKQAYNDGQRFCCMHLLLQDRTTWAWRRGLSCRNRGLRNFAHHQSELAPCRLEDLGVDDQHEHQGHQHTAEEIEINHVVQSNHSFKEALSHAFRTVVGSNGGGGVPSCTTEQTLITFPLTMSTKYSAFYTTERISNGAGLFIKLWWMNVHGLG